MKKAIRRLRLREGDILVVSDPDLPRRLSQLHRIGGGGPPFEVPIIFAPNGLKRVSREYLKKILERMENSVEKAAS